MSGCRSASRSTLPPGRPTIPRFDKPLGCVAAPRVRGARRASVAIGLKDCAGPLLSQLLAFFWPGRVNPYPGFVGRLGRVIHGMAVLVTIFMLIVGSYAFADRRDALVWDFLGLLVAMLGRGCRYAMARE